MWPTIVQRPYVDIGHRLPIEPFEIYTNDNFFSTNVKTFVMSGELLSFPKLNLETAPNIGNKCPFFYLLIHFTRLSTESRNGTKLGPQLRKIA